MTIRRTLLIVSRLALACWAIWVTANLLLSQPIDAAPQLSISQDYDYVDAWWNPRWTRQMPYEDNWQIGNRWYRTRDLMGRYL